MTVLRSALKSGGSGGGGSGKIKGFISVASDFPTLASVQNLDTYLIGANVTDNDPAKTNTGQSFKAGQIIVWDAANVEWAASTDGVDYQVLWGYQDFAAGEITGTSVTLEENSNGVGAAFDPSSFQNYADIYRPDGTDYVYSAGLYGYFAGVVDVTLQSGTAITLNRIPASDEDCRIWYCYIGVMPTSGYIVPPQNILDSASVIKIGDNFFVSKTLANTNILVGNASNVATAVAMSGDATLANTGALTIANNAITTVKINNSAVTLAKIANASANSVLVGAGSAGSGASYTEITLGTGLAMTGTVLSATATAPSFTDITSGTNTTAAMVVGTGASLATSGTGTIQATGLRTGTSNGNTALLQAYDVDGAAYGTFGVLTAGNTPAFSMSPPAGGVFSIDGASIGVSVAGIGRFTTLDASGTVNFDSLTASQVVATSSSKDLVSLPYSSTAAANTLAQWDANVNFQANALVTSYATKVMATASPVTLTAASPQILRYTGGVQNQTVTLPDARTLKQYHYYLFQKIATGNGNLIINDASGTTILTVSTLAQTAFVQALLLNNTTLAGTWDFGNYATNLATASTIVTRNSAGSSTFAQALAGSFSNSSGTVATTGLIRGTSSDFYSWRNGGNTGDVTLSKNSSDIFNFSTRLTLGTASGTTGTLGLIGSTSGTVTIQPQAAAGTYNFNLPTTAGSSGNFLTSAGGGSSPMTWTSIIPIAAGGTGADLSATGGASQVLKQSSVGANITVGTLAQADIAGLTTTSTPEFGGGLYRNSSSQNYYLSNSTTVQISENRTASNIYAGVSSFSFDNTNANNGSFLTLNRSRNATIGSHTALSVNDRMGLIQYGGSDGSAFIRGAAIIGLVDDTVSTGIVPTRVEFHTMDSSGAINKQAFLDSKGNKVLGAGTAALATSATDGFVHIPATSGTPTGSPTFYTGMVTMVADAPNSKLWINFGGGWKSALFV